MVTIRLMVKGDGGADELWRKLNVERRIGENSGSGRARGRRPSGEAAHLLVEALAPGRRQQRAGERAMLAGAKHRRTRIHAVRTRVGLRDDRRDKLAQMPGREAWVGVLAYGSAPLH
jgi:hypothetical protein